MYASWKIPTKEISLKLWIGFSITALLVIIGGYYV
jgi:hypothetical protein